MSDTPQALARRLRADEPLPAGIPRRFRSADGYVLLRWKVAPYTYVEILEHRRVASRVAEHVHHVNGVRDDNRPENLEPMTAREHRRKHVTFDIERAMRLYREGWTTSRLATLFHRDDSVLSRAFRGRGLQMRTAGESRRIPVDKTRVHVLFNQGLGCPAIAVALGIGREPVRRAMLEMGLRRKCGRVPRTEKKAELGSPRYVPETESA